MEPPQKNMYNHTFVFFGIHSCALYCQSELVKVCFSGYSGHMKNHKPKWLGLALALVLAFNTLLPFFAFYSPAPTVSMSAPSLLSSLLGDKVIICTGDGFALVKWSDLQAGKVPIKPHKPFFCPLCYISTHDVAKALLLTAVVILLVRQFASTLILFGFNRYYRDVLTYTATRPRAPPF
jgi:hypothetical protein